MESSGLSCRAEKDPCCRGLSGCFRKDKARDDDKIRSSVFTRHSSERTGFCCDPEDKSLSLTFIRPSLLPLATAQGRRMRLQLLPPAGAQSLCSPPTVLALTFPPSPEFKLLSPRMPWPSPWQLLVFFEHLPWVKHYA